MQILHWVTSPAARWIFRWPLEVPGNDIGVARSISYPWIWLSTSNWWLGNLTHQEAIFHRRRFLNLFFFRSWPGICCCSQIYWFTVIVKKLRHAQRSSIVDCWFLFFWSLRIRISPSLLWKIQRQHFYMAAQNSCFFLKSYTKQLTFLEIFMFFWVILSNFNFQ